MIDLNETFDEMGDEFLKFELIENPRHQRPDLCAFLLLDYLAPNGGCDMVSAATHDEIFLDTDCEALALVATKEDIRTLARCGVRYDKEYDCLAMYV